jgi:hypothetical protein
MSDYQIRDQEKMMPNSQNIKRVLEIKKYVAQQNGLEEGYGNYFFFARIGSNYDEYQINWEMFRDLAGPLEIGEGSIPIILISDASLRQAPELSRAETPTPHYQIRISPGLQVVPIANTWLELLVDNQVSHGQYQGPFDWFVRKLGISEDQLSQKSRTFLKL